MVEISVSSPSKSLNVASTFLDETNVVIFNLLTCRVLANPLKKPYSLVEVLFEISFLVKAKPSKLDFP